jgi:hypothetical protein
VKGNRSLEVRCLKCANGPVRTEKLRKKVSNGKGQKRHSKAAAQGAELS